MLSTTGRTGTGGGWGCGLASGFQSELRRGERRKESSCCFRQSCDWGPKPLQRRDHAGINRVGETPVSFSLSIVNLLSHILFPLGRWGRGGNGVFSCIPSFYPLNASSTFPQVVTAKTVPRLGQMSPGKINRVEKHCREQKRVTPEAPVEGIWLGGLDHQMRQHPPGHPMLRIPGTHFPGWQARCLCSLSTGIWTQNYPLNGVSPSRPTNNHKWKWVFWTSCGAGVYGSGVVTAASRVTAVAPVSIPCPRNFHKLQAQPKKKKGNEASRRHWMPY